MSKEEKDTQMQEEDDGPDDWYEVQFRIAN